MTEKTKNIGLTKPDETEFYDVSVTNENWDITDEEIGNIKNPKIKEASARENIENGDNYFTILGKIKRFFSDLKNVAFTGKYQDLEGKPEIPAAIAVKGNAETNYRTGNVNLTPDNIGALAKTAVVSNNTTTEAGYALDARQANPNVDGSLAKQISTLNSGLKKYYTQTEVNNIIEKNKTKSIVIEFVGATINESKAFFPKYTYWGYVGGKTTEIDNLIAQGHTILGGFICGGPHNDASISGNGSDNIGVIVGSATYYNVPYSFYVFSQAYQTIRIKVCVLYI